MTQKIYHNYLSISFNQQFFYSGEILVLKLQKRINIRQIVKGFFKFCGGIRLEMSDTS